MRDMTYEISQDASGYLALGSPQTHADQTPYSTDYVGFTHNVKSKFKKDV